ncbi:MAG TPA: glycosyltransferase family 2 protein [Bryobacteraceae bacterium]|nr:glycosyltransferase family 2 protein [Bryobacteraceae bacterium]
MTALIVFWISLAIPVYAYLGYPLTLILLRRILHNGVAKREITPFLSLIVPAYNESSTIVRKIHNSLALDYPPDRLEIVIACDGCKDGTPGLAKEAALASGSAERIRVLDFLVNRGKILTLNAAVAESRGAVIVFSDASAILNPDALRLLIRNFADPSVGSVSGKYTVIKPNEVKIGGSEDIYWKYETFLKAQESELSSTIGGHGHLHAIRAELYPHPPAGTINDDYIIHASVIARGWRAVYEPEAVIREEAREMTGFGRRIRIMAGNFQQLREIRPLLRPLRPFPLFFFVSRKVLRLAVPFAMIAAFIANLFLLRSWLYQALLAAQLCFYFLAILGSLTRLRPKFLMLPYYFSMINAAVFLGSYHAFTGLRSMRWK